GSEVLPAQAGINGQARDYLPGILRVERHVVEAVVAVEGRCSYRQRNRAAGQEGGIQCQGARGRIARAREFALRVDRRLEGFQVAGHEVVEARHLAPGGEVFHSFFKSAKYAVIAHVDVSAAKAELMVAFGPAQVL